jgi:predicted nucleotidyltransferase
MEEFAIKFQDGLLKDGRNGLTIEEAITEIIKRISLYNSKVPCTENIYALEYLNSALGNLEARTKDRKERGVEGTYEV